MEKNPITGGVRSVFAAKTGFENRTGSNHVGFEPSNHGTSLLAEYYQVQIWTPAPAYHTHKNTPQKSYPTTTNDGSKWPERLFELPSL